MNIGIFGALWAAIETTLGSALHVLNVPLAGVFLAGIGISVALIGRRFVPRRGSILLISVVTALLKMMSLGGVVLNPMIGIIAEGLVAELALFPFKEARRAGSVLAGGAATLWCLFHPFLTQGVLAGQDVFTVYRSILDKGAGVLELDSISIALALAILIGSHFLVGAVCGFLSYDLGGIVHQRLRTPTLQEEGR